MTGNGVQGNAGSRENLPDTGALAKVASFIESAERFLLTCHVKPDGDAIGSLLGLGLALRDMGKDVIFFTEDPVPETLRFLPGSGLVIHDLPLPLGDGTALIILDCNETKRIGRLGEALVEQASRRIILDHHLRGDAGLVKDEAGRVAVYLDSGVFATGAVVLWLLEYLAWPISPDVATNLYAAILSDTGCFCHGNTTVTAFQMAETLVRKGADLHTVSTRLYQSYPLRRQQLLALVLKTLEVHGGGAVAFLHATPEMFRACGAGEEDAEDFVAYARCIDTVELAVFIKEVHGGQVSVSLRSKKEFDVARLARVFGGGGHFHAAGFRMAGSVSEARQAILEYLADLEMVHV
ncbi:MAG: DHH family phosphoesterase [Deltaproteobacteria bacterium]